MNNEIGYTTYIKLSSFKQNIVSKCHFKMPTKIK